MNVIKFYIPNYIYNLMRDIIKKVLRESNREKMGDRLRSIGLQSAKNMGFSVQQFIDLAFDGDLVSYVSEYVNQLLHLEREGLFRSYYASSKGLLDGFVFTYKPSRNMPGGSELPSSIVFNIINAKKIIPDFLDKTLLLEFINEYYFLDAEKIKFSSNWT